MGDSTETQEKIIAAALKIFARKGYNGTTTAEIARECGVAEGTLFKYYKTKKDLLRAVLSRIVHEIVPQIALTSKLEEELQKTFLLQNPKENIKDFIKSKIAMVESNLGAFKILINELQYHEDLKNEYLSKFPPSVLNALEGVYRLGVEKGFFRDIEPHIAARSLMGMVAGLVLEKNVLGRELDIDASLDTIFDIYMNGVAIKKGE